MNSMLDNRLLKYGTVGVIGMTIDFSLTWICKEKLRLNKYLANSIGFCCAVVNNFLLNRYWTFRNTGHSFGGQFAKFILVSLIGLAINNVLLYLFLKNANKNFYFKKLLVIGLVFCWNYFINFLFTFN